MTLWPKKSAAAECNMTLSSRNLLRPHNKESSQERTAPTLCRKALEWFLRKLSTISFIWNVAFCIDTHVSQEPIQSNIPAGRWRAIIRNVIVVTHKQHTWPTSMFLSRPYRYPSGILLLRDFMMQVRGSCWLADMGNVGLTWIRALNIDSSSAAELRRKDRVNHFIDRSSCS